MRNKVGGGSFTTVSVQPLSSLNLEPNEQAQATIGKRVTVFDYPDGRLLIRYKGVELAYRTFDKVRQVDQAVIADNKQLGPILAMIRDKQLRRDGAISATPVSSRSAKLLYEPSKLATAQQTAGTSRAPLIWKTKSILSSDHQLGRRD